MSAIAYIVRAGFVFTDASGATPRTYAAGETVLLDAAVGDCAHQLERTAPAALSAPAIHSQPKRARATPEQAEPVRSPSSLQGLLP